VGGISVPAVAIIVNVSIYIGDPDKDILAKGKAQFRGERIPDDILGAESREEVPVFERVQKRGMKMRANGGIDNWEGSLKV
jgi:hypothetical protein